MLYHFWLLLKWLSLLFQLGGHIQIYKIAYKKFYNFDYKSKFYLPTICTSTKKTMNEMIMSSVTRLGGFWNFLATNFITKVAQMFGDFLGSCEKHCFLKSNLIGYFWGNFWKNLGFFISTSGHTDYVPYLLRLPKVLHGIGSLGLEQFPFATGAARDSTPATSCSRLQPVDSTIHAPDRTSTSWWPTIVWEVSLVHKIILVSSPIRFH